MHLDAGNSVATDIAAIGTSRLRRAALWPAQQRRAYSLKMAIAITEDHRALGQTASDFLAKHDSRGAARALLEAEKEPLPPFWGDLAALGWLGLHLPESVGGSGYGLPELVVVVEELGRAVAPGPFVPTVIASAVIDAVGSDELKNEVAAGTGRRLGLRRCRARRPTSRCRRARPPGRRRRYWAVASPTCSCCRRATTPSWSMRRRAGSRWRCRRTSTRHGARARVTLDGAAVEVIPGGAAGARRLGPGARRRRGRRRRHRVHGAGRGLRQGARAVRPAHRHLPGGQAPLRQHGRGRRAGDRRRVGRGAGGRLRAANS